MHPLLAIPALLLGFLVGRKSKGSTKVGSRSPIDNVTLGQWTQFVATMGTAPKNHIGRKGRLGTFQMDARRLADVGAMKLLRKGRRGDEEGVWIGEWAPGLSESAFLGSMPLQYAVFVRSMRDLAPKVAGLVGVEVDAAKASLSGLLGVGHAAGERAVEGFVKEPAVRARFSNTREMFARSNGIF